MGQIRKCYSIGTFTVLPQTHLILGTKPFQDPKTQSIISDQSSLPDCWQRPFFLSEADVCLLSPVTLLSEWLMHHSLMNTEQHRFSLQSDLFAPKPIGG